MGLPTHKYIHGKFDPKPDSTDPSCTPQVCIHDPSKGEFVPPHNRKQMHGFVGTEKRVSVPVEVPSGSDFGHPVFAIFIVGLGSASVAKGAAADAVDADEEDEDDDIEDGDLVPVTPHVFQDPSLA